MAARNPEGAKKLYKHPLLKHSASSYCIMFPFDLRAIIILAAKEFG